MGIKLRGMRWVGQLACVREVRNAYEMLVGKAEERDEGRNERVVIQEVVIQEVIGNVRVLTEFS
jgi:hypothetical protein